MSGFYIARSTSRLSICTVSQLFEADNQGFVLCSMSDGFIDSPIRSYGRASIPDLPVKPETIVAANKRRKQVTMAGSPSCAAKRPIFREG